MTQKPRKDEDTGTVLDSKLARPRLKEGLIPTETGIFLRFVGGEEKGRVVTLSAGGTYLVGREGADIPIEDSKISRKHAEISLFGPDTYFLRDLASTNGTFLNGKRVHERAPLEHENCIRIGDTVMMFLVVEGSIEVGAGA